MGVPQASEAVTEFISGAGTVALQPSVTLAGQVIDGAITSAVQLTVLDIVDELLHPSSAVNVLVCERRQLLVTTAPSAELIVAAPQPSVADAVPNAAAISDATGLHPNVTAL